MGEKGNLQTPKLKIHNQMYKNALFLNISLKFTTAYWVFNITLWINESFVCVQNFWSVTGYLQIER